MIDLAVQETTHLTNQIARDVKLDCRDITLGVGIVIEEGVRITCNSLSIGDFVYIGRNTTIRTPAFHVGDYTRISEGAYLGGAHPLDIGRNGYIGRGAYLDSNGWLTIEDNVGIGAGSQIWTHIRFGDTVQGLNGRWHQERPLIIREDAWLVGRVVVSHASQIGARALVLNESNVLCDIPDDTTWAGNPAKDVTDKLGQQMDAINVAEKRLRFTRQYAEFVHQHPEHARDLSACGFDPISRTYTKRRTAAEVAFIRWCLRTNGAKFRPLGEGER